MRRAANWRCGPGTASRGGSCWSAATNSLDAERSLVAAPPAQQGIVLVND